MTGDGTTTALTLSVTPQSENQTQVYIDGVYQSKDNYSVSGSTLTFSTAPPSGTSVEVMVVQNTTFGTPSDGSITSAKLSGDLTTPGDLDVTGTVTSDGLTVDTDTLVVDATNNRVGIGISSPDYNFHVTDTGDTIAAVTAGASSIAGLNLGNSSNKADGGIRYDNSADALILRASNTERMRVDNSGTLILSGNGGSTTNSLDIAYNGTSGQASINADSNGGSTFLTFGTSSSGSLSEALRIDSSLNLLVGKTADDNTTAGHRFTASGFTAHVVANDYPLLLNRLSSEGTLLTFRKDSTTVGSIGTVSNGLYIASPVSSDSGLRFSGSTVHPCDTAGAPRDNAVDLGYAQGRFDDIYATNGTIQTSDRNEKQDIEALSDAEQRVAVAAKGLLRKFRWISSVEENGDDARIHFGIIAQDLQDAFTAEGLDAGRYAMFINSTWTDEETGEERSRMGVRYSELLAFIISAI